MQEYHCLYRTKTNKKGGYLSNSHVHEYRACSGVTLFSDPLRGAMTSQRGAFWRKGDSYFGTLRESFPKWRRNLVISISQLSSYIHHLIVNCIEMNFKRVHKLFFSTFFFKIERSIAKQCKMKKMIVLNWLKCVAILASMRWAFHSCFFRWWMQRVALFAEHMKRTS